MPFEPDPFQQVTNISWGGVKAAFVVVTFKGEVYYAKAGDIELQQVALPIDKIVSIVGCDCAKIGKTSTFVIAGSYLNPTPGTGTSGFICTSSNGISWARTFQTPQGVEEFGDFRSPWAGTVSAIVYSPGSQMFAVSCMMLKFAKPNREEIYTSSNGAGWSLSSGRDIGSVEEMITHASSFPLNYCSHNSDSRDDFNHNVPGGIMHDDAEREIKMRPRNPPAVYYWNSQIPGNIDYHTLPLTVFSGFDDAIGSPPSNAVLIERKDEDGNNIVTSAAPGGLAIATCVAGKGTTWLAGGFAGTSIDGSGAVAVTKDGGEIWRPLGNTPSGVVGIAVGEAEK